MPLSSMQTNTHIRTVPQMIECKDCEHYNPEEDICMAFECNGIDCPTLPCEVEDESNDNRGH